MRHDRGSLLRMTLCRSVNEPFCGGATVAALESSSLSPVYGSVTSTPVLLLVVPIQQCCIQDCIGLHLLWPSIQEV